MPSAPADEDPPLTAELAQAYWDQAADFWDEAVETGQDYYRTELPAESR